MINIFLVPRNLNILKSKKSFGRVVSLYTAICTSHKWIGMRASDGKKFVFLFRAWPQMYAVRRYNVSETWIRQVRQI